jgi:hypothetical protein
MTPPVSGIMEEIMRWSELVLPAIVALSFGVACQASAQENAEDFIGIHKIEITTKNLDQMLSLFAGDATLTSGGKTYQGKEQVCPLASGKRRASWLQTSSTRMRFC